MPRGSPRATPLALRSRAGLGARYQLAQGGRPGRRRWRFALVRGWARVTSSPRAVRPGRRRWRFALVRGWARVTSSPRAVAQGDAVGASLSCGVGRALPARPGRSPRATPLALRSRAGLGARYQLAQGGRPGRRRWRFALVRGWARVTSSPRAVAQGDAVGASLSCGVGRALPARPGRSPRATPLALRSRAGLGARYQVAQGGRPGRRRWRSPVAQGDAVGASLSCGVGRALPGRPGRSPRATPLALRSRAGLGVRYQVAQGGRPGRRRWRSPVAQGVRCWRFALVRGWACVTRSPRAVNLGDAVGASLSCGVGRALPGRPGRVAQGDAVGASLS